MLPGTNKRHLNRRLINMVHEGKSLGIVSSALSGTTGGALIGATFGIVGSIVGGIVGGIITGYSGYKSDHKITTHKKSKATI